MKTILSLIIACICTIGSLAQNGINYKALIKDASGNILATSPVSIQFIIYKGVALTNNVYQESHTTNTDANGFVIVNIGEGATSDVFTDILWGEDEHFLNVQVNTGSGLIDMGTTQFMAVPYALHAKNVSGLESIDEGNGEGLRVIGKNPDNAGDLGLNAIDLSGSASSSATLGATGDYAIAMNRETTAQGDFSTAMGLFSRAIGNTSTAMGFETTANGFDAVSMGSNTNADATQSVALGRFNEGGGNTTAWVETDAIFEVGNGVDDANRSNALTVFKNGGVTAPDLTIAEINSYGDSSLVTKEYTDDTYAPKVQTTTVIIPHAAFMPARPNNDFYLSSGTALLLDGDTRLIAPVEIPIGSTITSISAYIRDSSTAYNYDFSLVEQALINNGEDIIFTLTTDGVTFIQALTYSDPIFISDFRQYYISIKPTTGGSWDFSQTGVKGIRITYTN